MFLLILFLFSLLPFLGRSYDISDEGKLRSILFKDYVTGALPTARTSDPVHIGVKLYLKTVYNLDTKNQKLSSKVHILASWKDNSLKWNETLYSGLNRLLIPLSDIWKPDIVLINLMEDKMMFESKGEVLLDSKGIVSWSAYLNLDTFCRIDTTFYPFDEQTCDIVFSKQYTSDPYQYLWHNDSNNITEGYVSNGEWNIKDIQRLNNTKHIDLGTFTDIIFRVDMERKTKYYYWIYVVPMISLATVDVLTFCLPVKSQEKLNICLFVFLSLVYLVTTVNQSMPSTSDDISKFGTLLWCFILISGLIILINILIITMVHRKWAKFISKISKGSQKKNTNEDDPSLGNKKGNIDIDITENAPSIQSPTCGDISETVSPQDVDIQTECLDNKGTTSSTITKRDPVNQNTKVREKKSETKEIKEKWHFVATIIDFICFFVFPFAFFASYWILLGKCIP
ncbi:CHRNN [Mytilus coruscus]|uniref:CHRNN n=1 Tax=Mytilus coruscus TaxID=42192 RepID=A0A6J8BNJ5_MYTCO|nr:CHRNN [Mytilus coruscus]